MDDVTEQLISVDPVTIRRRVSWGECDPAGVVYTPRFAEYAASAFDFWMRHALDYTDRPHPEKKQVVFPMRALALDFVGMLAPDDVFDMQVTLTELRTRTFSVSLVARRVGGAPAFSARMTRVAFDQTSGVAVPVPPDLHTKLSTILPNC